MKKLKAFLINPNLLWYKKISSKILKKEFKECGKGVSWGYNFTVAGAQNIRIGEDTAIGPNCIFYATMAPLTIGKKVLISPNVTIVTGEHRTDLIGVYMRDVTEAEKRPENDAPVVIEDDVWIGSNVTIMKGVTIGRGSIIHAGAVITKNIKPYTVYISEKIKIARFTEQEIIQHEKMLKEKHGEF
jgi:acetyltransferase-like isoleucine patch superfamily enzyme